MDKSNKISVRINGEDTYLDRGDKEAQKELQKAQDEQASAIEDWMEEQEKKKEQSGDTEDSSTHQDDISVLERSYPIKNNRFSLPKSIKKIVMAGVSAVLVGMALGYIMLNVFASMETPEASSSTAYQDDVDNEPSTTETNSNEESTSSGTPPADQNTEGEAAAASQTSISLPAVRAFVVQAGIFSTQDQAEVMQSNIESKGVRTFIWPRDGQFYLFAGIAPSKAEGEQIATLLKAQEIEVYVKEWSVPGGKMDLNQTEGDWIQKGMEQWQTVLGPAAALLYAGEGDVKAMSSSINTWSSSKPEGASDLSSAIDQHFSQYVSSVDTYRSNKSTASLWDIQASLFGVWLAYEQMIQ